MTAEFGTLGINHNDEPGFQELLRVLWERLRMDGRQYKPAYLKRRIAVRMRSLHLSQYADYIRLLRHDGDEPERLLERLTINVSEFYRDPMAFQRVRMMVVPELAKEPKVKIWSAGCANGEEPYSLAILLQEALPPEVDWEILATDVDPHCLVTARQGLYKRASLDNLPEPLRRQYFQAQGEWFQVHPALKQRVHFQLHDLTRQLPSGPFQLIVCRNVLIYFQNDQQERLFLAFHRMLATKGFLVLGKTESVTGVFRGYYRAIETQQRIYQWQQRPESPV